MTCAFSSAAFSANAFSVCVEGGGGNVAQRFIYDLRAFTKPKESPTREEVTALVAEARARLRFKAVPYVLTDLAPLIDRMKRAREQQAIAEFRTAIDMLLALEEAEA